MPIFGAKSRAARGCASKLACGRRIDPFGGHIRFYDTLRQICDCPRADRVVRPYRMFFNFAENACNFAIVFCRGERGIDPYGISGDAPSALGHELLHDLDRQQDEDDDDRGLYDL